MIIAEVKFVVAQTAIKQMQPYGLTRTGLAGHPKRTAPIANNFIVNVNHFASNTSNI
jgi:hypothetical protein